MTSNDGENVPVMNEAVVAMKIAIPSVMTGTTEMIRFPVRTT
jgi:hypothetical protein